MTDEDTEEKTRRPFLPQHSPGRPACMELWAPEDQGMRSLHKCLDDLWVPAPGPVSSSQCEPVMGPVAAWVLCFWDLRWLWIHNG